MTRTVQQIDGSIAELDAHLAGLTRQAEDLALWSISGTETSAIVTASKTAEFDKIIIEIADRETERRKLVYARAAAARHEVDEGDI